MGVHSAPRDVTRRKVLKSGAVVGASAVWAVPVVQAIAMTPAHAETPSGPRTIVEPPPPVQPPSTVPQVTPNVPAASGDLAKTGTSVPVMPIVAAGATALAFGAGMVALARDNGDEDTTTAGSPA